VRDRADLRLGDGVSVSPLLARDRMNRRKFTAALFAAAALPRPESAHAQPPQRVPVIGFLHPGLSDSGSPVFDALREGLRDVGYVEGQTVKVEARWARGKPEILSQLAQELVQLHVDLLVATARPSIEAARAATTSMPIVAKDLESDPVASGYVASLAHPGGNLTGLFLDAPTLCGKWLQQISDIVPNLTKVAALWDATTGTYQLDAIRTAAKARSIGLSVMEFRDGAGLETALERGLTEGPQAVIQFGSPLIRQAGPRIAEILSMRRIPATSQFRTFPDGGGLMSYGPDLIQLFRRIGPYVAKVLHGARPADLPIERPTKFELVVNLRAAKALGVTIPHSLLATADDAIE
jgi:putative tryptophan/tyrosine transport system substrate-binding protein